MKELLETIVYALVDNKDEVHISEEVSNNGEITFRITADPNDVGRIIGRNGNTITAIRKVMIAYAIKLKKRVNVEVM